MPSVKRLPTSNWILSLFVCLMTTHPQEDVGINVRQAVTGQILASVKVKQSDMVLHLRQEVMQKLGGQGACKLVHDSQLLADKMTLQDAGLHDGADVLFVRIPLQCVTASYDCTARVWCVDTGVCKQTLTLGESDPVRCAQFAPNAQTILTWSLDGRGTLWNASSGKIVSELEGNDVQVAGRILPEFSSDGNFIVGALDDCMARIWDAETGSVLQTLVGHGDDIVSVAFSQDADRVLTASLDGVAFIWAVKSGKRLVSFPHCHDNSLNGASFSPDCSQVVTASRDGTAKVWDVQSGSCLHTLVGHQESVRTAIFSPDGHCVLTSSSDGTVRKWSMETGLELLSISVQSNVINTAIFSPDGSRLLVALGSETLSLFCSETGACIHHLRGHRDWVRSAAFSSDGIFVASASYDGTAKIWSAVTGECLQTLTGHTMNVETALILAL